MLEYLILNNRIEAAWKFKQASPRSIKEQLTSSFTKGKREQFFRYFNLLRQQPKLQFYLRVYFLVYSIHPSTKSKAAIPEEQINSFKEYLNSKGSQLAKTNQFLQFYALPFIKKHLQHPAFKTIFKKQWITNLKQKLILFIQEEEKRMKEITKRFQSQHKIKQYDSKQENHQKIKQMQRVNKELFAEVKQFTQKYLQLEQNHKSMIDKFNYHIMQSQSKWFQITKQLVNCSKNLIQMISRNKSTILNDRKFIKIQKRIQKYQRFVNKQLDQLITQPEDISIFDKPSNNELSYTVTPYTQKNITTFLSIEQFIPINILELKKDFQRMKIAQKKLVIEGVSWRIRRSKNTMVQRQNIVVLFINDLLGIRSGQFISLISSKQLLKNILHLLSNVSLDRYGLKQLFSKGKLYKELVIMLTQLDNQQCIEYICIILQQLTFQQDYNNQLISMGLINILLNMLKQVWLNSNENIVENILACLLNFSHMKIGIDNFENQVEIFSILSQYLSNETSPLVKVMSIGILYCLAKRKKLFDRGQQFKILQIIEESIYSDEDNNNTNQLQMLADAYRVFNQRPQDNKYFFDKDNQIENQSINFDDNQVTDMEEFIKGHEMLLNKYPLVGKDAIKQTEEVLKIVNQFLRNNNKMQSKNHKKQNIKSQQQYQQSSQMYYQFKSPSFRKQELKQIKPKNQLPFDKFSNKDPTPNYSNYLPEKYIVPNNIPIKNPSLVNNNKQPKASNNYNRIKKSNSVERNIATSYRKQKYYDNDRQGGQVAQFKPTDQKGFCSPQMRPSREEVLKQLNQELRANKQLNKQTNKHKNHSVRQNSIRQNRHFGSHKNLSVVGQEYIQGFQSRPKLRRTPPKQ